MAEKRKLSEQAVLFAVTLHSPGTRRKVGTDQVDVDTDKLMLHVKKDILDSDEVRAVGKRDRQFKGYLRSRAFPSLVKDSVFLLPLALVEDVDQEGERFLQERAALVDAAVQVYPAQCTAAMARLDTLADKEDYPTVERFRAAWGVDVVYLMLDTPESLKVVEIGFYEREAKRAEATWREAETEIKDALLTGFAELVSKMVTRLSDKEDGKRRQITEKGIAKLEDFLTVFEKRNIVGYKELGDLVAQARKLMKGANPGTLKASALFREQVKTGFEGVQAALEPMLEEAGVRHVRFAEEGGW